MRIAFVVLAALVLAFVMLGGVALVVGQASPSPTLPWQGDCGAGAWDPVQMKCLNLISFAPR